MNNLDHFYNADITHFSKNYFSYLEKLFKGIDHYQIKIFVEKLIQARHEGKNIFFIGNGGSAATASHFANDIAIGTKSYKKPFKAISLTDNQAIISAIGNDYGFEFIFSKQIENFGNNNDLLIAISASGNSLNLINAFKIAKSKNIKTISITAFDGGKIKDMADNNIHIPTGSGEYGPAEDIHMILAGLVGSFLIRFVLDENK